MDYHVVQRRLKKAGIALRGRGPTPEGRKRIAQARRKDIDEDKLRSLAGTGLNVREIRDLIDPGLSEECVRDRMVELGLDRLPGKARPEKNYFWNGGYVVDADGYILQKSLGHPHQTKAGYVRQHRLVMEKVLGRYLKPAEVVDHIDGDTSNNHPDNLRLFACNADHLRATLTGEKLPPLQRERLRREAVLRAKKRVAAILAGSGNGADR